MAEVGERAGWDPEEAAGRRRRGLIIVAVIAAVGIPLALVDWWSTREVEREASQVAGQLRVAAAEVDDVSGLVAQELTSHWDGDRSPLDDALGHGRLATGAVFLDGGVSIAYEVRHWLETRCVHLLLTEDEVRTEVGGSGPCTPRTYGS